MTDPTDLTRRTVLTVGSFGAFGGALVLAGCAADVSGDGGSSSSPPEVTDESPTEPSGAPDAPAAGGDIAALADVPVGGSIDAKIDGKAALISQPTAGQVKAFSAVCTHQGCMVAAAGDEFHCPCHGSTFDAATGDVISGPAQRALDEIAVAVSGDRIIAAS